MAGSKKSTNARTRKGKAAGDLQTYNSLLTREPKRLGESVAVQNPEDWADALAELEKVTSEGRKADSELIKREMEISRWRKGYAVLRFIGPGAVQGVVQTDQDPNHRANPRPLNEEHLLSLTTTFATEGVVDDRRTPIRVKAPPEGLNPDLEGRIAAVDITDPNAEMPTLSVVRSREDAEIETRLERDIFALSDGSRLLSDEEVTAKQVELAQRRQGRQLATLLNGNHRVNAMIAACKPLADAALHIATSERNKVEDFNPKTEWANLMALLKKATYVVEVFDYKTPPHVQAWLAENDRARPQYAPEAGEAVWSLVETQETLARVMIEKGQAADREAAIAQINGLRERQQAAKTISDGEAQLLSRLASLPMNRRGTSLGDRELLALMSYPTTMELLTDTRMALPVYNKAINNTHAKALISDQGAGFLGHIWLGVRLLLKVANTAVGPGLTAAENYLASVSVEAVSSDGTEASRTHFANLTSKPQEFPALFPIWESDGQPLFESLVAKHFDGGISLCKADYRDQDFVVRLRRLYFEFGRQLAIKRANDERARRFGTTVSLYALLPLWATGEGADKDFFYPATILPCRSTYSAYEKTVKAVGESLGIWALEFLVDRYHLPWTAGSSCVGKSQQTSNWWRRVSGPHLILLRCIRNVQLGSLDARLSVALDILEDPRLASAVCAIDETTEGGPEGEKPVAGFTASELRTACGAMKTSSKSYTFLSRVMLTIGTSYGTEAEVRKQLTDSRISVRDFIFGSKISAEHLYSKHPVLKPLVPKCYFTNWPIREWADGWNDDDRKRMGTATSLLGWFLASERLRLEILPTVFERIPETSYLLYVSRRLAALDGKTPWWTGTGGFVENSPEENESPAARPKPNTPESTGGSRGKGKMVTRSGSIARTVTTGASTLSAPAANKGPSAASGSMTTALSRKQTLTVELPLKSQAIGTSSRPKPTSDALNTQQPLAPPSKGLTSNSSRKKIKNKRQAPKSSEFIEGDDEIQDSDEDLPSPGELAQPPHVSRPSDKAAGAKNEESPDHDFGDDSAAQECPATIGTGREFEPTQDKARTLARLPTVDTTIFSNQVNPGHVLVQNPNLLPYGLDNTYACQTHIEDPESASHEDGVRTAENMEEAVIAIMEEGQRLRQSVLAVTSLATKTLDQFPYAAEYASSALAHMVQFCKDAHTARIAEIMTEHWGEVGAEPGSGMLDALAMAHANGLYAGELFSIDSRSRIHLYPKRTYPVGIQPHLSSSQHNVTLKRSVGGGDPVDLHLAWQRMAPFVPVHGYGRTIAETTKRGIEGLFAVAANENLATGKRPKTLAAILGSPDDAPKYSEDMPNLQAIQTRLRELISKSETVQDELDFEVVPLYSHPVVRDYRPCVSTGIYDAYVPPGAPAGVAVQAREFQLEVRPRWLRAVGDNNSLFPTPQRPASPAPLPENEESRIDNVPLGRQLVPHDTKTPLRPTVPQNSTHQPRSGLKILEPSSSQLGPAVQPAVFPPPVPSQSLEGSQPWYSSQPPFPFGQYSAVPMRRSLTPPTPEATQRIMEEEDGDEEGLDLKEILSESVLGSIHDTDDVQEYPERALPKPEDEPRTNSKVDPYAGLGKRQRGQSLGSSPENHRKASRMHPQK